MIAILNSRLETVGRLRPESMSLNLEERKSTATVTAAMDAPDIACGTWLRDETEPGKGIIWRVKSCETQYEKRTKSFQLEHVINTLRDVIIFGELTPQAISGTGSGNCTAKDAAKRVLAYQGTWALGDFEFAVSNPYSFNGEDLYSAMETITRSLDGACWEYDLSRLPFRLHVRKLPNTPGCEMRLGRNIQTIRRTVDRSRMYTRFYPVGANNLHLPEGYVSRNESIYGAICKTETDQSQKTESELRAWANERLRNHCEPSVTVQISGMDWSTATGETMDSLKINKLCRAPLPEWNTFIREKVTKLSWSDKIKEPKKVNVTLANLIEDVASIINNAAKASSRAGRSAAKKAEEDHAWFEDTTDHVAMVAEAVAGEGADKDWSRVSSIVVDGNGIHQRVTKAEGEIVTHQTMIEMNEEEIALRAKTTEVESMISVSEKGIKAIIADTKGEIESGMDIALGNVRLYVDDKNADLKSEINVERGRIGLVVSGTGKNAKIKPAAITAAINQDGSSNVYLSADKIALDGNTRLSGAMSIRGGNLTVLKTAYLGGGAYITGGNSLTFQTSGTPATNYTMTPGKVAGMIVDARVDGDTLKLWKFNDAAGSPSITFNKPIVQTKVSGSWSNGAVTVQADENGAATYKRYLSAGTKEKQDGTAYDGDKQFYVPIKVHDGQGTPPTYENTGYRAYVDATATYNAGRDGVWVDYRDAGQAGYDYNPQGSINTAHAQLALVSEGDVLATWKIPQLHSRTVTANASGDTFYPLSGYAGLSAVTVNIPVLNHSATLTRVYCGANSSGTRSSSGKLYYYDAQSDSYKAASSGDAYWFRASVTIDTSSDGDTKTVNYA